MEAYNKACAGSTAAGQAGSEQIMHISLEAFPGRHRYKLVDVWLRGLAKMLIPTAGSGGQLGQGHPPHQHAVPEGPPHAGLRQGLARAHRLQAVPDPAAEPLLVDPPAPRRQALVNPPRPTSHPPSPSLTWLHKAASTHPSHVWPRYMQHATVRALLHAVVTVQCRCAGT